MGETLVLSHPQLPEDIVVSVNRLRGNRATLGVEAPDQVHVRRGELERHTADVVRVPLADILAEAQATPKKGHEHEPVIDFDGGLER